MEAINGLDRTGQEIADEFLDIASLVQRGLESIGVAPSLCAKYRSGRGTCSGHIIREEVLRDMVLGNLSRRSKEPSGFRRSGLSSIGRKRAV